MKKRILFLLVALVLLAGVFFVTAQAADETSGTTGDVSWSYDADTTTLTISGTGAMADYKSSPAAQKAPWLQASYANSVTSIVVDEGVTSIGTYAFYRMTGVTSLKLPSSLTAIGNYSCAYMQKLEELTIPEGVTAVGDYAFNHIDAAKSITLPESLQTIGKSAFSNAKAVTSITLPKGITSVGNYAFQSCAALESVTVNCTPEFGYSTFYYCTALKSAVLPEGMTTIPSQMFMSCRALESITIPSTVTKISSSAFSGCSGLKSVTMSEGVAAIESAAFSGCTGISEISIPDSVTSIGEEAFGSWEMTQTIKFGRDKAAVDSGVEFGLNWSAKAVVDYNGEKVQPPMEGSAGENVKWKFDLESGTLTFSGTGAMLEKESSAAVSVGVYPWRLWKNETTKVVVEEGVTSVSSCSMMSYSALTSVSISSTVENINKGAFQYCSALTELSINENGSLKTIGESAFASCGAINGIVFPKSVTTIETNAFSGAKNTQTFTLRVTEGYAKRNLTLGSGWRGNATVVYDPGLDNAWADGITFTMKAGDEEISGTIDIAKYRVTFERPMYNPEPFTLTDISVSGAKEGTEFTVKAPDSVTVALYSGSLYMSGEETLTITPAQGVEGDELELDIFFNVPTKEYTFEGSGTEDDPYKVSTPLDLQIMALKVSKGTNYLGKFFKQANDIDLKGINWSPIGTIVESTGQTKIGNPFRGTYDGAGYKISNLVYENEKTPGTGFFGSINGATIKRVHLDSSCSFKANGYMGGIVGMSTGNAAITDCINEADVYATCSGTTRAHAAGIVGDAGSTSIIGCYNYGKIDSNTDVAGWGYSSSQNIGGISGSTVKCDVMNCHNYGSVRGGSGVGGVIGSSYNQRIIACSNSGSVSSEYSNTGTNMSVVSGSTGGVVGSCGYDTILEGCFNTGDIAVDWPGGGGVVGQSKNYYIANCYSTGKVTSTYTGEYDKSIGAIVGYIPGMTSVIDYKATYYLAIDGLSGYGKVDYKKSELAAPEAKTAEELRSAEFLSTLQSFDTKELDCAVWAADSDNVNQGYPIITGYMTKPNYENDMLSFSVNGVSLAIDQENRTISTVLSNDTDMTAVAPVITVSDKATVSPASGEATDFSQGPVTYTVTAENGDTKTYTATLTQAGTDGIATMKLEAKNVLLTEKEFNQDTLTYELNVHDYDMQVANSAKYNYFYMYIQPAETGATVSAVFNDGDPVAVTPKGISTRATGNVLYNSTVKAGDNTLTLTITPPEGGKGKTVTYTFNIHITPTFKTLFFKGDGQTLALDKTFDRDTNEYTLDLSAGLNEITPSFTYYLAVTNPQLVTSPAMDENGVIDISEVDKVTMTLSDTEGGHANTYTINLDKPTTYTAEVAATPANAFVTITDKTGAKVEPDENGVYTFNIGDEYNYVAVAKGYVTATGTLTGSSDLVGGKLKIDLTKAADNNLTKFDAEWPVFRGNDNNMAITSGAMPTDADSAELLWANKSGSGYASGAISSPIIVDGHIYAYAGNKLLKVDKTTGQCVATGDMVGTSDFAIVPPTYADGMIFVGLSSGRVQAFNAETLESLWVYQSDLKGQSNSQITYSDGCIYTGFWNGESKTASFVCIDTSDEDTSSTTEKKYALWTYEQMGGFYWAGAYVSGDYVAVGTDDGESGYTSTTANLLVFNKNTGKLVDSKTGYTGDIRSSIAYDEITDRVYFTSKGGYLYSEQIDWETGKINTDASKAVSLGGMSTSTPVVYKGRAYVGVSGTSQFGAYSGHNISVIDLDSWSVAYTARTMGYPQTSGLLTKAYEDKDGYVYVYFTDNYTPGQVRYIKDKAGVTSVIGGVTEIYNGKTYTNCAPTVFTPKSSLSQYCICSPISDEDGTFYFKNDTGYMMAVTSKITGIEVTQEPTSSVKNSDGSWTVEGIKVVAKLTNGGERDITDYVTFVSDETNENKLMVSYTYGFASSDDTYKTTTYTVPAYAETVIKGDANGDGTLDASDALAAMRIAASGEEPTAEQLAAADMNGDGVIDALDALLIARAAAAQ